MCVCMHVCMFVCMFVCLYDCNDTIIYLLLSLIQVVPLKKLTVNYILVVIFDTGSAFKEAHGGGKLSGFFGLLKTALFILKGKFIHV